LSKKKSLKTNEQHCSFKQYCYYY